MSKACSAIEGESSGLGGRKHHDKCKNTAQHSTREILLELQTGGSRPARQHQVFAHRKGAKVDAAARNVASHGQVYLLLPHQVADVQKGDVQMRQRVFHFEIL